jgi:chromosome segregation ATPase
VSKEITLGYILKVSIPSVIVATLASAGAFIAIPYKLEAISLDISRSSAEIQEAKADVKENSREIASIKAVLDSDLKNFSERMRDLLESQENSNETMMNMTRLIAAHSAKIDGLSLRVDRIAERVEAY